MSDLYDTDFEQKQCFGDQVADLGLASVDLLPADIIEVQRSQTALTPQTATTTGRFDWTGLTVSTRGFFAAISADPTPVIVDDYSADITTTGVVAVDGSVTGQIETGNDQDWFRVNLVAGGIYAFDLKGVASGGGTLPDPGLLLLDSSGGYLAFDHDSGIGSDSRLVYSPPSSATFYLSARDVSGTPGSYTLVATYLGADDYAGNSTTSGTVTAGVPATGNIQFNYDQDWFRVELTAGRVYAFDLKGLSSGSGTLPDPNLSLYSDTGSHIAADNDSGIGSDAFLRYSPLNNGVFYLSTGYSSQTGTYTLLASDIGADDYLGSSATTGVVAVGGSATGDIQFNSDQDWFRIDLTAGQIYSFDLKGTASGGGSLPEPNLNLLDGTGVLLASDSYNGVDTDAQLIYSPLGGGTYYLSAWAGYASAGTYTLTATHLGTDDHLASSGTTSRLAVGGSVSGNIQFVGDQDGFHIDLTAGRIYSIDMKGVDSGAGTLIDPYLRLLNSNADYLVFDNESGTGSDARLLYSPLVSGDFLLSAEGGFGTLGSYTLTATDIGTDDYAGSLATTGTLAVGGAVSGNIQFVGDQDWFRLELTEGRIYAFDMKGFDSAGGTLADPFLVFLDSAGEFLASDVDSGTGADARITLSADHSGTYYLSAHGANGTYTLQATDLGADDYAGSLATTGSLAMGGTATGNIQFDSDQDWFRVELLAGHFYRFDMKGGASGGGTLPDPFLQFRDGAAGYVSSDFDSGTGADARLGFNAVSSGTYYLSAIGSGATGTYTLTAADLGEDDYAGDASTLGNLAVGDSISGNIQLASESDWFRIDLSAGRIYVFDLKGLDSGSGTLSDPHLQLRDGAGNVLFNDYDSGTGRDARMTRLAPTGGTYYLAVQGLSEGATGSYTLAATDIGSDDFAGNSATAGTLAAGDAVTGDIQFTNDEDWFRLDLTAGTTYIFALQGADSGMGTLVNSMLQLYSAAGLYLDSGYNSAGNGLLLVYTPTSSGAYYLSAAGVYSDNLGTYTLNASLDDYTHSALTGGSVAVGNDAFGAIQYFGDQDWFRVDLNAGGEYVFDLKGVDTGGGSLVSGYLVLFGGTGNYLNGDDSHLFYKPSSSGTYYLAVQGMNAVGTYTLSANLDDFKDGVTTTGVLAPGGSVTGMLEGGADVDWLKISLTAGTSYAFSLEGRDSGGGTLADPLLRLRDSNGSEIASNLDGGLGRDAHLTHIATTSGTYYLSVESQNTYGSDVGTYTLSSRSLGSGYQATPVANAFPLSGTATLDGLTQGSAWQFSGPRVLTYSFNDISEAGMNLGGPWTEAQKDAVREALLAWEVVANISFVEIPGSDTIENNTANIAIGHAGSYFYPAAGLGVFPSPDYVNQLLADLESNRTDYPRLEGDVLLDDYASEMQYLSPGDAGFWVGLHELGHALGLKHPFDDGGNGRPTFIDLGIGAKDVNTQTAMSYDTPATSLSDGYSATPMLLDIQAIQRIYGANTTYHSTDNSYTLTDDGALRTLWDTGGNDWLDASNLGTGIQLNLEAGSINRFGFQSSVTAIAYGVSIENARGSFDADTLIGTSAANILEGGNGNDLLDGGAGTDTLTGGLGNDSYVVDNRGDRILETSTLSSEIDSVQATLSWNLGANLENLTLLGTHRFSANGNGLDNTLTGNAAGNLLNGGRGADTLTGGAGNDTYVVDRASDVIQESGADASDSVRSWVDWTLGANLENLTLLGVKQLSGAGNSLDNRLTGNGAANVLNGGDGNDTLSGASGNDTLTGGAGSDTFAFTTPLNAVRNVDTITDFVSGTDKIELSSAIFREIGFSGSPSSDVFFHAGSAAHDTDDRILYDQGNGGLYYDVDGNGALAAVQFAVLSGGAMLQYSDISLS